MSRFYFAFNLGKHLENLRRRFFAGIRFQDRTQKRRKKHTFFAASRLTFSEGVGTIYRSQTGDFGCCLILEMKVFEEAGARRRKYRLFAAETDEKEAAGSDKPIRAQPDCIR